MQPSVAFAIQFLTAGTILNKTLKVYVAFRVKRPCLFATEVQTVGHFDVLRVLFLA
jgi:hypothetical protein